MFRQMLDIQLSLIVYLVVGIICQKLNIINGNIRKQFIRLILIILMPCMVFQSFKNVTVEMLRQGILALAISFVVCICTTILGRVFYFKVDEERKNIMRYGTLINNAGFAGLPVVGALFGDYGLILASIFLIPIRIFMWSAGITMLSAQKQSFITVAKKIITNPSIIAVFLGLIRGIFQLTLPVFLDSALSSISDTVSPLAMIAVGSIIGTVQLKGLINTEVIYFTIVRLGIIPIMTLFFTKILGFDEVIVGVSTVLTSMPAASTTALLADQYDSDVTFASSIVFVTTILSIFTSSLLMLLL